MAVEDRQHGPEHMRDVVARRAHEVGDGGEMGRGHGARRNEPHLLVAHPFNCPAAHDAFRVHYLAPHDRRVPRRAGRIVIEARVEARQMHFAIKQVVRRVLERPRQQLAREVDAQNRRFVSKGCKAGDGGCSTARRNNTAFDARQTRRMPKRFVAELACRWPFPTASLQRRRRLLWNYANRLLTILAIRCKNYVRADA